MARVFSERLRAARKVRGITQKELADMLGMEKSAVSKFERDVNSADAELLAEICRALNVSSDYLLGLTKDDRGPAGPGPDGGGPGPGVSELDTPLIEAYRNAPDNIKGIVDYVLAPYKQVAPGSREAS